ncbi:MAG: hypothetical protein IKS03_00150 [Ruminococcus sp.]|nr:hypothetical protein [Ruminococcus sp.]
MKNITRKIVAIAVLLCVAASGIVSCGSSNKESESEAPKATEAPVLNFPFEIGTAAPDESDDSLNVADPTEAPSDSEGSSESAETEPPVTEIRKVTDEKGQNVTEVVPVTDAKGQPVTKADGQQETQVVEVTSVYVANSITPHSENDPNRNSNNNNNSSNNSSTTTPSGNSGSTASDSGNSEYQPSIDGRYAMWLDISKDENFLFEGKFIKITFKIKDDTPDGDYRVRISPDLSNIAGQTVNPGKVVDGTIRVNKGDIEPADDTDSTKDYYYGDNVACKQGDTIDYYLNVKNNTGLAAFCVWFYYDKNAMELVSAEPTGEFAEIAAQSPEFGAAPSQAAE